MVGVLEESVLPARAARARRRLSGPSFAREVARGMPTAVTAAARDAAVARSSAAAVHDRSFRVYTSDDVVGVELGGAVKNVIAIAAGVSDGLGFGHNSARRADHPRPRRDRAARRSTRRRPAHARGPRRHGRPGAHLHRRPVAQPHRRPAARQAARRSPTSWPSMKMVAEGVRNTKSVHELAKKLGVEMPITEQMYLAAPRSGKAAVQRRRPDDARPEARVRLDSGSLRELTSPRRVW